MTTDPEIVRHRWIAGGVAVAVLILIALVVRSCGDDDPDQTVEAESPTESIETPDPLAVPETEAPAEVEPESDEVVAQLQADLTDLGFYSGPINGVDDGATQGALRDFQASVGLDADGIYGPQTAGALDEALGRSTTPGGEDESLRAITVTVGPDSTIFDNGVSCVLGPDDSGSIQGNADDGTTISVTLDGTASRVVVDGPFGSYDAPTTSVSNDQTVLTIRAAPPEIEVLVALAFCSTA